MDLSFSPDLNAGYCYLIVFAIGSLVARYQVAERLGRIPSAWIRPSTWMLFSAYALVPVALFWLLDRTSAIHDTSLFAALLVGFGYRQILAGTSDIRVSSPVSKFWQPFVAWSDKLADRIREYMAREQERRNRRFVSTIVADDGRFEHLKQLAMFYAPDSAELEKRLQELSAKAAPLGKEAVSEKLAGLLLDSLKNSRPLDYDALLYERGITSAIFYYWYVKEARVKLISAVVGAAAAAAVLVGLHYLYTTPNLDRYYVWRLEKSNATTEDQFRTRMALARQLQGSTEDVLRLYSLLADRLRYEGLRIATAEAILGIFLESQAQAEQRKVHLPALLIERLRNENPDIRMRIHNALLHLYTKDDRSAPEKLARWKPSKSDAATDIDGYIAEWRKVWQVPQ